MALFDIGRICIKLAGRDAGKKCVVVDMVDATYVLVDGETRRKKVNTKHLEPLAEIMEIDSGASHEAVKAVFKGLGIEIKDTKPKSAAPKQVKHKAKREAPKEGKKAKKTEAKKEVKAEVKREAEEKKESATE